MHTNITQAFAAAIFGVRQSTVSRSWDVLRPLIGQVLAEFLPHPAELVKAGTVLVDGTICPTWDWTHIPDLYSAKAGYPGMNLQTAATLNGRLAAVGPIPVHGARHDAHAFATSGLAALLTAISAGADLGYVGVEGIEIVPIKRAPGGELSPPSRVQHRIQQNPRRCRTRHRPPQDMEPYAKLGDQLRDHVAGLRGRQFLIMGLKGFCISLMAHAQRGRRPVPSTDRKYQSMLKAIIGLYFFALVNNLSE